MVFPMNWSGAVSRKLRAIAEATLNHARENPDVWFTAFPQMRGTISFVYECDRNPEPHFHMYVQPRPGGGYRPAGGTYCPSEAADSLWSFWLEQIHRDEVDAYATAEAIINY